jgi:hypothetical protein
MTSPRDVKGTILLRNLNYLYQGRDSVRKITGNVTAEARPGGTYS